jgi:hypothetical protein
VRADDGKVVLVALGFWGLIYRTFVTALGFVFSGVGSWATTAAILFFLDR